MKATIQINSLSHENLVDLFSVALYGSGVLAADYNADTYAEVQQPSDECFEDKLATLLLAGKTIEIIDCCAEGEIYKNPCQEVVRARLYNKYEDVAYELSLQDILRGINALSDSDKLEIIGFLNDPVRFDQSDAENILQFILFGEQIYG